MTIHLLATVLFSIALGYELAFTRTTNQLAGQISSLENQRRVQDALTPPRSNLVSCFTYVLVLGAVSVGWYRFGWLTALLMLAGILLTAGMNDFGCAVEAWF